MRIGDFSAGILPGREWDTGHVFLNHGDTYSISMTNHSPSRRCDAQITVDGKVVGEFRIQPSGSVVIERPENDTGRFTFFKSGSDEAIIARVASISSDQRGLIQVRFRAEYARVLEKEELTCGGQHTSTTYTSRQMKSRGGPGGQSVGSGMTGLSGKSHQSFTTVGPLNYDLSTETTISLRLVHDVLPEVKELKSFTRANPIPSPVS